jgi:hypothetical protein
VTPLSDMLQYDFNKCYSDICAGEACIMMANIPVVCLRFGIDRVRMDALVGRRETGAQCLCNNNRSAITHRKRQRDNTRL